MYSKLFFIFAHHGVYTFNWCCFGSVLLSFLVASTGLFTCFFLNVFLFDVFHSPFLSSVRPLAPRPKQPQALQRDNHWVKCGATCHGAVGPKDWSNTIEGLRIRRFPRQSWSSRCATLWLLFDVWCLIKSLCLYRIWMMLVGMGETRVACAMGFPALSHPPVRWRVLNSLKCNSLGKKLLWTHPKEKQSGECSH